MFFLMLFKKSSGKLEVFFLMKEVLIE
jgi:hypothetical protein